MRVVGVCRSCQRGEHGIRRALQLVPFHASPVVTICSPRSEYLVFRPVDRPGTNKNTAICPPGRKSSQNTALSRALRREAKLLFIEVPAGEHKGIAPGAGTRAWQTPAAGFPGNILSRRSPRRNPFCSCQKTLKRRDIGQGCPQRAWFTDFFRTLYKDLYTAIQRVGATRPGTRPGAVAGWTLLMA